jgi:hypothetical protein
MSPRKHAPSTEGLWAAMIPFAAAAIREAVLEEREACAQLCDEPDLENVLPSLRAAMRAAGKYLAEKIRARSQKHERHPM